MDAPAAADLARSLMNAHGLSAWTFAFNRRRRTLGLCRYQEHRIELSGHFVVRNDEPAVRDTILHEIAHALAGPAAKHGPAWKRIARSLGATPKACDRQAHMPAGRWQATCPGCGQHFTRHRRPILRREYACRRCGPVRGRVRFQLTPG